MTRLGRHAFVATALLVVAAGGGCDSSTTKTSAPATDASTTDAATTPFTLEAMRAASVAFTTKFCNAMAAFDPILLEAVLGTLEACIDAQASAAELAVWFPYGSQLTPDSLRACADALDLSTREAYARYAYEGSAPPACHAVIYGALPVGGACSVSTVIAMPSSNQCASGKCLAKLGACGQCVAGAPAGASCADEFSCAFGTTCRGDGAGGQICKSWGEIGQPCNEMTPCHAHLECVAGQCAATRPDDSCSRQSDCDSLPNFRWCNPSTNKCESILVKLGAACGFIAGQFFFCAAPAACVRVRDPADSGTTDGSSDAGPPRPRYACVPTIDYGHACNFADNPGGDQCGNRGQFRRGVCFQNECVEQGPAQCTPPVVTP